MAPKKRQRDAEKRMRLECANNNYGGENIDALTAEPLHATKYLRVKSPDGSLCLYYNTASLIKVAEHKGEFMQPPHFMEPMSKELILEIERLEDRKFSFSSRDKVGNIDNLSDELMHRHERFEEMIDSFYLLNPTELYVCPYCYSHYLYTRFIPSVSDSEKLPKHMEEGSNPPLDPLDVFDHMRLHPICEDVSFFSAFIYIIFCNAKTWKAHVTKFHNGADGSAREYRLRDFLCSYYHSFNRENDAEFKRLSQEGKKPTPHLPLTQQRYWTLHASYNKFRYNRLVDIIQNEMERNDVLQRLAFPNELTEDIEDPNESDFIVDSSSISSASYDGPRYSPSSSCASSSDVVGSEESLASLESSPTTKSSVESRGTLSRWIDKKHTKYTDKRLFPEEHLFLRTGTDSFSTAKPLYDPFQHHLNTATISDEIDVEHLGEPLAMTKTLFKPKEEFIDDTIFTDTTELLLDDCNINCISVNPIEPCNRKFPGKAPKLLLDDD